MPGEPLRVAHEATELINEYMREALRHLSLVVRLRGRKRLVNQWGRVHAAEECDDRGFRVTTPQLALDGCDDVSRKQCRDFLIVRWLQHCPVLRRDAWLLNGYELPVLAVFRDLDPDLELAVAKLNAVEFVDEFFQLCVTGKAPFVALPLQPEFVLEEIDRTALPPILS